MPIVLNQDERVAASRRQVKIPIENWGFDDGIVSMNKNALIYQQVDNANKKFFAHWNNLFNQYSDELTALSGEVPYKFTETDLDNGARELAGNYFYPLYPSTTINSGLTPLIHPNISPGVDPYWDGTPASTASLFEQQTVNDIHTICGICIYGIVVGSANTYLDANYSGGTSLTLHDANIPTNGVYIIVDEPMSGGYVLEVISGAGTVNLTVRKVLGNGTCNSGIGNSTVVINDAGFWSNAERDQIVMATPYNFTATEVYYFMNATAEVGGTWDNFLDQQKICLLANDDSRTAQKAQIATAINNITVAKAAIIAWDSVPVSSPPAPSGGSRFNNTAISALSIAAAARTTIISTRISEITAAAGSLTGTGDSYSGTSGFVYNRYDLLNKRINRQTGSLRRYYNQIKSISYMSNMSSNNTDLLDYYSTILVTSRLSKDSDGSNMVYVDSAAGFIIGSPCYVVDEENTEISCLIEGVNLTDNTIRISVDIPTTYLKDNLARIYMVL